MADVHRVRIEDPRHHLRVGADVGGRNVLLRADLVDDLARVAPGQALLLAKREQLRIADHAALRAAERKAHQGALPGHPHRERLDLVQRHGRVVADATLGRAARHVVDHAVALECVHRAVVHLYRHRDLDPLLAVREDLDQVRVDSNVSPTRRSWAWASSNGFSRRWVGAGEAALMRGHHRSRRADYTVALTRS